MKVFLDGPRNDNEWLKKITSLLKCDYVKPIGDGWNIEEEIKEKETCDIHLYVISPKQIYYHNIAKLLESASDSDKCWKNPKYVVYCLLYEDGDSSFSRQQIRSLIVVKDIYKKYNNCIFCTNLEEAANLINTLNN